VSASGRLWRPRGRRLWAFNPNPLWPALLLAAGVGLSLLLSAWCESITHTAYAEPAPPAWRPLAPGTEVIVFSPTTTSPRVVCVRTKVMGGYALSCVTP